MWWFIIGLILFFFVATDFTSGERNIDESSEDNEKKKIPLPPFSKPMAELTSNEKIPIDPESPWGKLREEAFIKHGKKCNECGSVRDLNIHHKIPLSLNGANELDNLIVLCATCHKKVHNVMYFNNEKGKDDLEDYGFDISKKNSKISKIAAAIRHHKKLDIHYIKLDGSETDRTIMPEEIFVDHDRYYLRSFCYLRNDKRTFKISRINKVKIEI